ncbi:cyclopropane-fatty-acyl-phospholipid synthase [Caballeronia arationis]|uniref:SAM-dependent methyltransferase n=1 Tax=Caballeronia arationis TaxID=1777142 RepID=UPI00074B74EF|nr:cyclopropane-fatty-acyl-phospholipid synthase family protein [Caballeronia arationis]SAK88816.1 cyclopropane-fatty-acyl-phospholipid synthase [Caballeronia arationis]
MSEATLAQRTSPDGFLIDWCERGRIPDSLVRLGMRQLIRRRLADESAGDDEARAQRFTRLVDELRASPIAIETHAANAQHYEVPAEFFRAHLGPHLKYSCCLYREGTMTLAEAERAMFALYATRARLADGQRILDLGCGWGSLSMWLAERYPRARIVALSNSRGQREFIEARAAERGLSNLRVVTGDVVDFEFDPALLGEGFDRILSVEMFEHMKNYRLLLKRVAGWMRDDAKLFVHVFAHRTLAYHFEVKDGSDWMSKYFFTGGTMPSESLLLYFQDDLAIDRHWCVSGTHYERTANDWLVNLDAARSRLLPLLIQTYGPADAPRWFQRWRMFYMAVAELFGFRSGEEWGVAHYLFTRR